MKKKIGIEQHIPFDLMNSTIIEYLKTTTINKEELYKRSLEYNKGENRAKKLTNSIYSTITKNSPILKALKKNFTAETFSKLSIIEKNMISISMLCLRFPLIYDTLVAFAKLFNVQDSVNRQYITQTLSSIYGSNRTLDIALDAVLRMFVDSNLIKREKIGLFKKVQPSIICDFVKESWLYTMFELNGKKTINVTDLTYEPFSKYLLDVNIDWKNTKILNVTIDYQSQIFINKVK